MTLRGASPPEQGDQDLVARKRPSSCALLGCGLVWFFGGILALLLDYGGGGLEDAIPAMWLAGVAHPIRVEVVEDETRARRIASALHDKYGWQERWLMAVRPRSGRDAFLSLHLREDGSGCPPIRRGTAS